MTFVEALLAHADVEENAGDNCRRFRVSAARARTLNLDDRLAHYAVVWSDDSARIVTIHPINRRMRKGRAPTRNRGGVRRHG